MAVLFESVCINFYHSYIFTSFVLIDAVCLECNQTDGTLIATSAWAPGFWFEDMMYDEQQTELCSPQDMETCWE